MSGAPKPLCAIFIDGETKTGKGAASKAIADALAAANYQVYYDVGGDFFRRYAALVRHYLGLSEDDALPNGDTLLKAAQVVHRTRQAYESHLDLGDLQRPAISRSVSVLGALPLAQRAGSEWYAESCKKAYKANADVLVLDGRNPRARVTEIMPTLQFNVQTILDLYMTCTPEEAAIRALRGRGQLQIDESMLKAETKHVIERRERDRNRLENPFVAPDIYVAYDPQTMQPNEAIAAARQLGDQPPAAIIIDNTTSTVVDMLHHVSTLALSAFSYDLQ